MPSATRHPSLLQTYSERASVPNTSPLATYLFRLIAAKKTNLCVSADVTSTSELIRLAEEVGDSICILKTHADIIQDFGHKTMQLLVGVAQRKGFLIFEDRKFGDIGSTVQKQYTAGPLQIVRWANIVNCHIFPGPAIVTALHGAADDAVTALNTRVETQITGPADFVNEGDVEGEEQETVRDSDDDDDDDLPPARGPAADEDGDRLSSDEEEDEEDTTEDDEEMQELERRISAQHVGNSTATGDRSGRKQSVVSVSTTISTKTESLSPQPTPLHHRGISCVSAEDWTVLRETLGDPPMARGLLLLAEMSSAGNLMDESYTSQCVSLARSNKAFVMGFIAQRSLNTQPGDNFVTMTPGVQIGSSGDGLGQQYNTPEKVVKDAGVDVIIVGRGVYGAQDRRVAAEEYRTRAWRAYEERIGKRAR